MAGSDQTQPHCAVGPDIPAQTHPEVICAVAEWVREAGAIPLVGDSPAWGDVQACLAALGIVERLNASGVEIVRLDRPVRILIEGTSIGLSRTALQADAIINLPKLKAHQQLGATFAVKNMYGCVVGKEKAFWHFAKGHSFDGFCRMLIASIVGLPRWSISLTASSQWKDKDLSTVVPVLWDSRRWHGCCRL
jgi:uncharacterized protein (DUF362 family)